MGFEEREIDKKLKAKDIDLNSILDDMHCLQEIRNSNEQLLILWVTVFRPNDWRDHFSFQPEKGRQFPNTGRFSADNGGECGWRQATQGQIQVFLIFSWVLSYSAWRFAHQCCEALCIGAREFYPELEKHKDLLQKMANFLAENSGRLNPLTVSFYGRTLISFLSTEPEKVIVDKTWNAGT
jgi:hypothetical protein